MKKVYAYKNQHWIPTPPADSADLVYMYTGGSWKPVKSGHMLVKNAATGRLEWKLVFGWVQYPPTNVKGRTPTSLNAVTLDWGPPADNPTSANVQYQVRQYENGVGAPVLYPWTTALSQSVSGLKMGTNYEFEVVARATVGPQIEAPSPRVKLLTGSPATHHQMDSRTSYIIPLRPTDTWSAANKWGEGNNTVKQGYISDKTENGYGVVRYNSDYNSLWQNVVNNLTEYKWGAPEQIADNATVLQARISRVHHNDSAKGGPTPEIYVRGCKINTSSTAEPKYATRRGTFIAPAKGADKTDIRIIDQDDTDPKTKDVLTEWAQYWLNKGTAHNGLLIWRTDGATNPAGGFNGLCALRGLVVADDWRLEMDLTWNFDYPKVTNARWL